MARRVTVLSPTVNISTDRSKAVLLWIIYVISVLFLLCFRARLFIDALWSPAGKGLTSWLSFVKSNCEVITFLFGSQGQVWCLIVSIPDLCTLFTLVVQLKLKCLLKKPSHSDTIEAYSYLLKDIKGS